LRLHLAFLPVLLRYWLLLLLLLGLILDSRSHHGRKVLGQLGGKLEFICADRGTAGLLLWCRRVLEPLQLVQLMVFVLLLVLGQAGESMVFWLRGLMLHLRVQVAMLGELLIVLSFCAVDDGRGVALLHDGILRLWGGLLVVVVHHGLMNLPWKERRR
jgi:hypothetical protein